MIRKQQASHDLFLFGEFLDGQEYRGEESDYGISMAATERRCVAPSLRVGKVRANIALQKTIGGGSDTIFTSSTNNIVRCAVCLRSLWQPEAHDAAGSLVRLPSFVAKRQVIGDL